METDSLLQAAEHISFAERNNMGSIDVLLQVLAGGLLFMLLLVICMKVISYISQKTDKNKHESQ